MDKKAQLGFLSFLIAVNAIIGIVVIAIYYDNLKARTCDSDSECGKNSFCDGNNRCQFNEIIKKDSQPITIQKHNFKWGIIFIGISIIASVLILRFKKQFKKSAT